MVKAKAAVSAVKIKKNWHSILAPKRFNSAVLGETFVSELAAAVGRIVHFNLKDITDNIKDQSVYLRFRISGVAGNNLDTEVIGYYIMPSALRKLTRRNANRLDESFVVVTKDGKRVRIKPTIVTAYKTVRSVCSAVRKAVSEQMAREVAKVEFEQLVEDVVTHKLQSEVKKKCSKVYPIKIIEIRILEFAREGKAVKVKEEKEEVKEEKKAEEVSETKEETPKKAMKKKTVTEEMQEDLQKEDSEVEVAQEVSENFGEEVQGS